MPKEIAVPAQLGLDLPDFLAGESFQAGDSIRFIGGTTTFTDADCSGLEEAASITFAEDSQVHFGPDTPLKIAVTGTIRDYGSGPPQPNYIYADNSGASSPSNAIGRLECLGTRSWHLMGGLFAELAILRGTHLITADADAPDIRLFNGILRDRRGTDTIDRLIATGGSYHSQRDIAASGILSIGGSADVTFWRENPSGDLSGVSFPTIGSNAVVNLLGGKFRWYASTINPEIISQGGIVDFSRAVIPFTHGGIEIDANTYQKSAFESKHGVTITGTVTQTGGNANAMPSFGFGTMH